MLIGDTLHAVAASLSKRNSARDIEDFVEMEMEGEWTTLAFRRRKWVEEPVTSENLRFSLADNTLAIGGVVLDCTNLTATYSGGALHLEDLYNMMTIRCGTY